MALTGPVAFRVGAYALVAHPYRDAPVSSVTLLPRVIQLGESMASFGSGFQLTLHSARGSAALRLSPLDLELGVLIGRAPKCSDVARPLLNDGISRVHLLLRKGVAYDLASTQGTYTYHRRVRSAVLDDEGTDLRLGTVNPVFVRWQAS